MWFCIHSFIRSFEMIVILNRCFNHQYAVRLNWRKVLSINFVAKAIKILQNKLYWTRDKLIWAIVAQKRRTKSEKCIYLCCNIIRMVELQCVFLCTFKWMKWNNSTAEASTTCVCFHHMIVVQIAKYTHLCWLCAIKFQVKCRSANAN